MGEHLREGHFTEGMSTGWDMSLYGGDGFFGEPMGAKGKDPSARRWTPCST